MDAVLKREFKIVYEDFETDEGMKTMLLKVGERVPLSIVTQRLINEYECFDGLLDKWYVDWDKLAPTPTSIVESVEDLIIDFNDFEADVKGALDELCEQYGITEDDIARVAAMTHEERIEMLDKTIEKLNR